MGDDKKLWRASDGTRHLDSVGSALRCFEYLSQFAHGERGSILTREEVEDCVDVDMRELRISGLHYPYHILTVWGYARWCRERDAVRFVDIGKNAVRRLAYAGFVERERKCWFHNEWAIPLEGVLRLCKHMKLRPYLKKVLGAVARWDTDALTMLPLPALLGIITSPKLIKATCTCYAWRPKST